MSKINGKDTAGGSVKNIHHNDSEEYSNKHISQEKSSAISRNQNITERSSRIKSQKQKIQKNSSLFIADLVDLYKGSSSDVWTKHNAMYPIYQHIIDVNEVIAGSIYHQEALMHEPDRAVPDFDMLMKIKWFENKEYLGLIHNNVIDAGKVLVVGGSGYVGSWIVKLLLEAGIYVRATVHDSNIQLDDEDWGIDCVDFLNRFENSDKFLETRLIKLENADWGSLCQGIDSIIFCAVPHPYTDIDDDILASYAAVEGVIGCMKAAREAKIRRIILTSCATTLRSNKYKPTYCELDWSDVEGIGSSEKSKIFAERSAWF